MCYGLPVYFGKFAGKVSVKNGCLFGIGCAPSSFGLAACLYLFAEEGCTVVIQLLYVFPYVLGLSNLIMFYDSNDIQLSTETNAVTTEDTAAKYRAWHWNVIEVDGTDPLAMAGALEAAKEEKNRPTLIIGKTVMGRGAVTGTSAEA